MVSRPLRRGTKNTGFQIIVFTKLHHIPVIVKQGLIQTICLRMQVCPVLHSGLQHAAWLYSGTIHDWFLSCFPELTNNANLNNAFLNKVINTYINS